MKTTHITFNGHIPFFGGFTLEHLSECEGTLILIIPYSFFPFLALFARPSFSTVKTKPRVNVIGKNLKGVPR